MEFLLAIFGLLALALALFYFGPGFIESLVDLYAITKDKAQEWREIIDAWNRRATEEREPLFWLDDKPGWECPTCGFTCDDPYYLGAGKFCPECAQPLRFRGDEEATP